MRFHNMDTYMLKEAKKLNRSNLQIKIIKGEIIEFTLA